MVTVVLPKKFWNNYCTIKTNFLFQPLARTQTVLPGFSFGQSYSVGIMAFTEYKYHRVESSKRWINITTPSCFETQLTSSCGKHNFSVLC